MDTQVIDSVTSALANPAQISKDRRHLVVGELRVACWTNGHPIAYSATECPFCGIKQPNEGDDKIDSDGDGIPDQWEKRYGFNPDDAADADADKDGDTFSNLEEFKAGTNPAEVASKPEEITRWRIWSTPKEAFMLKFVGKSAGKFQVNGPAGTSFAKIGDVIEGWTVESYDDGSVKDHKKPSMTFRKGDQVRKLARDEEGDAGLAAWVINLKDRSRQKLNVDGNFTTRDAQYKVVDINPDRVLLKNKKDGRDAALSKITPGEMTKLQNSVPVSSPVPGAAHPVPVGGTDTNDIIQKMLSTPGT